MEGSDTVLLEQQVRETWRVEPQVCEFLVRSFAQALHGSRRGDMCVPFPTVFGKGERRDFQAAEACLEKLPFNESGLEKEPPLNEGQVRLLHWLLYSHKINAKRLKAITVSHLRERCPRLVEEIQRGGKNLRPDMVLETRNDEAVDERVESSLFPTFHGTHPESIHSIVRVGLLNMSNTHMQRTGTAFGEGIYLAKELSTAFSFTRSPAPSKWNAKQGGLRCVFVCTVSNADSPQTQPGVPGNYVVVKECNKVAIRYIFVYQEHIPSGRKIDVCALLVLFYLASMLFPVLLEHARWQGYTN